MAPYLEHPALWPDVHNSLIAALRDDLAPRVAPRYYVGLERRAYLLKSDDLAFIGRPDLAVAPMALTPQKSARPLAAAGVITVELPLKDEVAENYLEVHEVTTGILVTVIELLSPINKLHTDGRQKYERKREQILGSRTHLVEIDLLRAGAPMPLSGEPVACDYRILVSRASQRPQAHLYPFSVRQPIPSFSLPLLPGDNEPEVELGQILHALYARARFDLRLDYGQPPVPALPVQDAAWANELMGSLTSRRSG